MVRLIHESFTVSLASDVTSRNLTLKYLAESMKENALAEVKLRKKRKSEKMEKPNVNS